MKTRILALLCLLLAGAASAQTRKAVFIIVDGVPADMIERLHTPAIDEIAARGAYARAYTGGEVGGYSQTPTISAIGYTNLLTATWMNKHNVDGNSDLKPNYNYWTIFRIAKEQPKEFRTALYSSWTDNRTVLLGEGKPETGHLKIDFVCDGYELDTVRFPKREKELQIFDIDEHVAREAARGIANDAPDLSWVYLWYTDDAGHFEGNGAFFDEYTLKADRQIGEIWEAVRYREEHFDEEWMVVVTTDHERTEDGHGHGGQSARERTTWVATNRPVNSHFHSPGLAITDIAPSICRFMGFDVPRDVLWEQDGMPFIGPVDIAGMGSMPYDDDIILTWECLNPEAEVTVWAAADNLFRTGGKDRWIELGRVPASDECYRVEGGRLPGSGFCKVVLSTPANHLNRWVRR